jgi:hypothetical protein
MTFATEGRPGGRTSATRASPAPSPLFALLAVGGGVVEGALFGFVAALAVFVPLQLVDPSTAGGTGSPGLTVTATVVGFGVGAFVGGLAGAAATPGLLIAWAGRWRPAGAVALASAGVVLVLAGYFALVPPDAPSITVASIALVHAIVDLAILDTVGRSFLPNRGKLMKD